MKQRVMEFESKLRQYQNEIRTMELQVSSQPELLQLSISLALIDRHISKCLEQIEEYKRRK